jgi:anti-sigma factor RsiW
MQCEQVQELLSPYLDLELPVHEFEGVSHHLKTCGRCLQEYLEMKEMKQMLSALRPLEAPRSLLPGLMLRLWYPGTWIAYFLGNLSGTFRRRLALAGTLIGLAIACFISWPAVFQEEEEPPINPSYYVQSHTRTTYTKSLDKQAEWAYMYQEERFPSSEE